jgi:hypothetical protein
MKLLTFHRESNNFDDILSDHVVKISMSNKITWHQGLLISIDNEDEKVLSYIELKYGDSASRICKDRSPIPYVDYLPQKPEPSADKD